jgi:hypothetical protein
MQAAEGTATLARDGGGRRASARSRRRSFCDAQILKAKIAAIRATSRPPARRSTR